MSSENTREEKLKQIALAKAALDKRYGAGTLFSGDSEAITAVESISTGCTMLNLALGVGGFPKGRIVEIYGDEAVGKTLLALSAVAECQKAGGLVAFVDAEHALDPGWAIKLGVDWDALHIAQPQSAEEALSIVNMLLRTDSFDMIVLDSVAAMTPQAELDGEIGDSTVALQARLMAQALRIFGSVVAETNTCLVLINQMRATIASYGPTKITSGGRALRYYAGVRIELARIESLTDKKTNEKYGNKIKASIVKNKVAAPYKTIEYHIVNGLGIDNGATVLDYAKKFGLVTVGGSHHYWVDPATGEKSESFAASVAKAASELNSGSDLAQTIIKNVEDVYTSRQRENNLES